MSYIGIPPFGQTARTVTTVTATAGQTTFNITGGYIVGYVDVFLNGVLLAPSDITATDGLTVVLASGAALNDEFQAISYQPTQLTIVNKNLVVTKRDTTTTNVTVANNILSVTNRSGSTISVPVT
jgi:hypothetical protein